MENMHDDARVYRANCKGIYDRSYIHTCGRQSGLMVSALDSGSRGLGSRLGQVTVLCSLARHFYSSHVSLHPGRSLNGY